MGDDKLLQNLAFDMKEVALRDGEDDFVVHDIAEAMARIRELEADLKKTRCPIGLDEVPSLCSASTCYQCMARRLDAFAMLDNIEQKYASRERYIERQEAEIKRQRDLLDECEQIFAEFAKAGGAGYAFRSREMLAKLRGEK